MIVSFADKRTEDVYHGRRTKSVAKLPPDIIARARRKLDMINAAQQITDLVSPPGNHLEALKGDLEGFHSIRINAQWRITFVWKEGAHDVCIVDYHK